MVKRKEALTLKQACLKVLPRLITDHIRHLSHKASALKWYGIFEGNVDVDADKILALQVQHFKRYLFDQIIWYDYELVFLALLRGVEDAVLQTRQTWKPSCDMTHYRHEMESMSSFTDLVLLPHLRRLEFAAVPKTLRSKLIEKLHTFAELRVLVIGSGSSPCGGQWMFKNVARTIAAGMKGLTKLEVFSCKHDCCNELLEVLSRSCSDTLRVLDVEGSKGVNDVSLASIASLTKLEELNIFNTKLSDEAKARLLMALPRLTCLTKGDFLCDALGWIDYLDEVEDLRLLVTEFFPSQKYFFHEEWQMEIVSRMCPYISKMFFIFHETCCPDYLVLSPFEYLTDLSLYGGGFYRDRVKDLLELRGRHLTRLGLISVSGVDYRAIAEISISCPSLRNLSLINCELGNFVPLGDPNSDREYERRQAFVAMAREAHATIEVMDNVEEVTVQSPCKAVYLSFLLGRCPNVATISLGKCTEVSDDTVLKIYAQHGLRMLETFHCEKSGATSGLTMKSIGLLMANCDRLRAIGDIQAWEGVSPKEVGQFRQICHEQNLVLDTRSHQALRKYLEMRDVERRTYVNLIAGPTMERIRMSQRAREDGDETN